MSKALINEQYLTDIGDAIRAKNGETTTYTPAEMAPAILGLSPVPTNVSAFTNDANYVAISEIAPALTTGVQIATVTTNGTTVTLYAPNGGLSTETDPVFSASAAAGITATDITNWNNKSDFSGSYNDLSDKPTIPTVPTNVSAFTNDAGYITDAPLAGYVPTSRTVNGKTLTANISLTNTDVGAAATSHAHGSVTSAGAITANTALANGDRIVFSDSSDSNLLKRSSITFGTSTGQYLANNGSWQNVPASYDDTALAARVTALENLEWATYYSGRTNPVSSLGQDGDIYLQY